MDIFSRKFISKTNRFYWFLNLIFVSYSLVFISLRSETSRIIWALDWSGKNILGTGIVLVSPGFCQNQMEQVSRLQMATLGWTATCKLKLGDTNEYNRTTPVCMRVQTA